MNPITLNTGEQLDPQAVKLMRAIRQKESGGNYNAVGDSGTSTGAFQFQNATWKGYAKDVLGDENAEQNKANQNKVAYTKIKGWKDKGWTPEQVAAAWNAGEAKAQDGRWKTNVGHNAKIDLDYDTPKYVSDVMAIAKGQPTYNPKPFSQPTGQSLVPEVPQVDETTQPKEETLGGKLMGRISQAGTALTDSASGKINPFSGLLQTAGAGAGAIGDVAGAGLGLLNKGANYLTGGLLGKAEDKATELIGKGIEKVANTDIGKSVIKGTQDFSQSHPEATGNLKAIGNIAMAVPVVKGVGLAGGLVKGGLEKTFAGATEKAIQKELTSAAMRTVGGRKALENVGEDGLKILAKKEIAPVVDATGKYTEESLRNSSEKLGEMISHIENNELQPLLQKGSNGLISQRVPLKTYADMAVKEAEDSLKDASPIKKYFERIQKKYGDFPTIGQLNEAKRIVANNISEAGFASPTMTTDKVVRSVLQQSVEDAAKALKLGDVAAINEKMAQLIKADKLLDTIANRKVTQDLVRKVTTNAKGTTKGLLKSGLKKAGAGALAGAGFYGAANLLEK